MKRPSSGMVLLELLLAIAVVSLVATAGLRAFVSLGEILHRRNQASMESSRIRALEVRLRDAWDQRLGNRFQDEPWLLIEGRPTASANWLELGRLRMRTVGTGGRVSWWELDGAAWGPIEVNSESVGEWQPGTAPPLIRFRFPEIRSRHHQIRLTSPGYRR